MKTTTSSAPVAKVECFGSRGTVSLSVKEDETGEVRCSHCHRVLKLRPRGWNNPNSRTEATLPKHNTVK